MDISTARINCWANILFTPCNWTDRNKNGNIDRNELVPSKSTSKPEEAQSLIDNDYKLVFERYDLNGDGLSLNEVMKLVQPPVPINYDAIDLQAVCDALKIEGKYQVPGAPVMFCTEKKVPDGIERLAIGAVIPQYVNYGNCCSIGVRMDNGKIGESTDIGNQKLSVIVVPSMRLGDSDTEKFRVMLRHELVHSEQYMTGRYSELTYAMFIEAVKAQKFNTVQLDSIKNNSFNWLIEIEAYCKSLDQAIGSGNKALIEQFCNMINHSLALYNFIVEGKIKKQGADKLSSMYTAFQENIFPRSKADSYNARLAEIFKDDPAKSKVCHVYFDIDYNEYKTLY